MVAGLAFAARLAFGLRMPLDGDEATGAIVALQIAHGHPWLMEANFHYLGALNSYTVAPFTVVFGSTLLAVRTATATLGAAYVAVMYLLGRRLFGSHRRALVLGAVSAVFPSSTFAFDMKARNYGELLLLTALCLLMAVRIGWPATDADRQGVRSGAAPGTPAAPRRDWILFGLFAGLGLWNDILVAVPLAVMAACLLMRARAIGGPALIRGAATSTFAAMVTFSPWLAYNIAHPLRSLHGLPNDHVRIAVAAHGFLATELPIFAGGWAAVDRQVLNGWETDAAVGALLLAVLWQRRRVIAALLGDVARRRFDTLQPMEMTLMILPATVIAVVAGRSNSTFWEPRYLTPAAIVFAVAATMVLLERRPWRALPIAAAAGVAVVTAIVLSGPTVDSRRFTTTGAHIPDDLQPMVTSLRGRPAGPLIANYWLARPITYDSNGEFPVAVYDGGIAFPDVQRTADEAADPGWLFMADDPDRQRLTTWCAAHHISYTLGAIAGGAVLYGGFSAPVHVADLNLPAIP